MLGGVGDDRLAVASCLPLRGVVVEDDRPSVLRWIEVMEQVSVGGHQGLEHSMVHHPFALLLLLRKVLQEDQLDDPKICSAQPTAEKTYFYRRFPGTIN